MCISQCLPFAQVIMTCAKTGPFGTDQHPNPILPEHPSPSDHIQTNIQLPGVVSLPVSSAHAEAIFGSHDSLALCACCPFLSGSCVPSPLQGSSSASASTLLFAGPSSSCSCVSLSLSCGCCFCCRYSQSNTSSGHRFRVAHTTIVTSSTHSRISMMRPVPSLAFSALVIRYQP